MESLSIVDVAVHNVTREEAVQAIVDHVRRGAAPAHVSFINAHCINVACRDAEYRSIIGRSMLALPDGVGMRMAARITGQELRANVNGTDLFPMLCAALQEASASVYLLGAAPEVVERVRVRLAEEYPRLRVVGTQHGFFESSDEDRIVRGVAESKADVLLAAMGVPLQEKWLARNLERLGVRVAMGVGGLFDFYSRQIPRAPKWMRRHGMEWLYRLYQEPRRLWRRYVVGNPVFLMRVVAGKLFRRRPAVAPPALREPEAVERPA
jgi:N-acetylglucosaminyldiphosphoundecaprenol N-acetyl-beta-D-mannosaminyltransferase